MTSQTKRDRIVALVHEKDAVATELHQLRERERAIDAEMDALIGGAAPPSAASASESAAAAKPKTAKAAKAKAKKKAKATAQPAAPTAKAEPTPTTKLKPAAKPKAAASKPKATAKAKPKAAEKAKAAGATIKEKILVALKDAPAGLDVPAIAQRAYGSAGKDPLRMCQANLYNMQKQALVTHDGPIWRVVTSASA